MSRIIIRFLPNTVTDDSDRFRGDKGAMGYRPRDVSILLAKLLE